MKIWYGWVGNGNPLQYSCLENSMDRGAWQATTQSMGSHKSYTSKWISLSKERMRKEKQSSASSHICGSEGQLLFDTVLISGEDHIF